MTKLTTIFLLSLIVGCSSSSTPGRTAVTPTVKLNCSTIAELESCWISVAEKTKDCFFYSPSYSSSVDTLGTFSPDGASCSYGNKKVEFAPAVTASGLFPTETVEATLTFYKSGQLCLQVQHAANSSNTRIATYSDSSGAIYRVEPTSNGIVRFCGGKNYEAGPTELAEIQTQCPTATFTYHEGHGQSGTSPTQVISYYLSSPSTQEIACRF